MAESPGADRRDRGRRLRLTRQAELVATIDQLPRTRWSGSGWRHLRLGRDPLSGSGARIQGGRWNPPNSFAVLYLGTSRETLSAEFARLVSRQPFRTSDLFPRAIYEYAIALDDLLDLRSTESLTAVGLTEHTARSDDLASCQAVGEAAFAAGRTGILVSSATGTGDVLAVFAERLRGPSSVTPRDYEVWEA